ncbi:MAG: glycosyltransferase [Bacteroidales bacterium]|nr:glycosyltransferase [Bacteroidales bacterium]
MEGFGNNLLEMISFGLPVVINKYPVFEKDIEHLGFDLPSVSDGLITDEVVDQAYEILTNPKLRNKMVKHNLQILSEKLDHKIIAEKLIPLFKNIFTRSLQA